MDDDLFSPLNEADIEFDFDAYRLEGDPDILKVPVYRVRSWIRSAKTPETNLVWAYENIKLFRGIVKNLAVMLGYGSDGFTANEWLMSEHEDTANPDDKTDIPEKEKPSNTAGLKLGKIKKPYELEYLIRTTPVSDYDPVDHPEHYASGNVECIDWIAEMLDDKEFRGYLKGNMLKYLWRHEHKGKPKEDLEKCRWYLDKLISLQEDA